MRTFDTCQRKSKCINPKQGALTEESYAKHYGIQGGRFKECKLCQNAKARARTALNSQEIRKAPQIDATLANSFLLAPVAHL